MIPMVLLRATQNRASKKIKKNENNCLISEFKDKIQQSILKQQHLTREISIKGESYNTTCTVVNKL